MITRYQYGGITEVWVPGEVYRRWFAIECAHMEEVAGKDAADALRLVRPPSPAQINYYERETNHDVAAFLRALDANIQRVIQKLDPRLDDVERWKRVRASLHYGLTSSDVVDTALAMGLQECAPVVHRLTDKLIDKLATLADNLVDGVTIGRTHGQLAAPMSADQRWRVLTEMVDRARTRIEAAFIWADVGKLSGPVGAGGDAEDEALEKLGLRATLSTQIVPRDRFAHLAHCLAELTTVCEAIAVQVWLLAQQGINEIAFAVPPNSIGSSAMPHKRNPVLAENIRGLARMARSRAEELQLGVVQWGEHDLAHSSVERVAWPDLTHLVCTTLFRTAHLVHGLDWSAPDPPSDYVDTSERLRQLQAEGVPYVEAHARLVSAYQDGKIDDIATEGA